MSWWRNLERVTLRLTTRAVNASGGFILQQMPLAFQKRTSDFLALCRHWIASEPKGNDLDMVRLAFLALNITALEAARVPGAFAELGVWRGDSATVIHNLAPQRELYSLETFNGLRLEFSVRPAYIASFSMSSQSSKSASSSVIRSASTVSLGVSQIRCLNPF
jgi:Macrocin-O-methyltransferase (TylF)